MDFKAGSQESFELIEIDSMCRLCGNVNDQLIPIFTDEGAENELPSKLSQYLPVMKINEMDELPKKICVQCTNSVLVWHDFVLCCMEADKKLAKLIAMSDMYQQQKRTKDLRPKITQTDTSNMQTVRKIQYLVDNEDAEHFQNDDIEEDSQDVIKIKETYAESEVDDERPQCSKTEIFETVENGNKISRNKKVNSTKEPKTNQPLAITAATEQPVPSSPRQQLTCKFCDQLFDTKPILFDHYKDQHCDLVFHCEQCGDYLDRNDLIAHMIGHAMSGLLGAGNAIPAVEPTKKVETLESGGLKERDKDETKHPARKNGDTTKQKPTVAATTSGASTKTIKTTTTCHVCEEEVGIKQMTAHFEQSHKHLDKNECPDCNIKFSCRRLLLDHIKAVHQTKREYQCSECFKTFKVQSNLYQHKQSHQANSPNFQCAYCDKTFHFRVNLKNHMLVHTNRFTYECSVCKKRFNNQSNMTRHMLVHKTDTFSCHMCDFICKQRRYLDEHIRRRHRRAV